MKTRLTMERTHWPCMLALSLLSLSTQAQDVKWEEWKTECGTQIKFTTTGKLLAPLPETLNRNCKVSLAITDGLGAPMADLPQLGEELKQRIDSFIERVESGLWNNYLPSIPAGDTTAPARARGRTPLLEDLLVIKTGSGKLKGKWFLTELSTATSGKDPLHGYVVKASGIDKNGKTWSLLNGADATGLKFTFEIPSKTDDRLALELIQESRVATLVMKCLEQFSTHNKAQLTNSKAKLAELKVELDTLPNILPTDEIRQESMLNNISLLEVKVIEHENEVIQLVNDWVVGWGWYTGGIPRLDPFAPDLALPPDTSDLQAIRSKLKVIEGILANVQFDKSYTTNDFDGWITEQLDYAERKQHLLKAVEQHQDSVASRNRARAAALVKEHTLNRVALHTSKINDVNYSRHHDALADFNLMKGTRRGEYLQDEDVHLLVHNYTGKDDALGVAMAREDVPLSPKYAAELSAVFDQLESSVPGSLPTFRFAIEPVQGTQSTSSIVARDTLGLAFKDKDNYQERNREWSNALIKMKDRLAELSIMEGAIDTIRSVLALKTHVTTGSLHSVELKTGVEQKLPAKITYTLKTPGVKDGETKDIPAGSYTQYRYARLQVVAGLAIAIQPLFRVLEETDASKLPPKVINDQLQFMAGIKWYPCGGDLFESGLRMNRHRWNVFAAMSIPKPLNNFYFGAGWDFFPGVQVGAGLQLYRSFSYELVNNEIRRTGWVYDPAPFVSLGIDGSVFGKLAKFMFK